MAAAASVVAPAAAPSTVDGGGGGDGDRDGDGGIGVAPPNSVGADRPPPPSQGLCTVWLPQRARYCRKATPRGYDVCANHGGGDEPRVPCPIDPRHMVVASRLERHLRVCTGAKTAAARRSQPYFRQGANLCSSDDEDDGGDGGNDCEGRSCRLFQEVAQDSPVGGADADQAAAQEQLFREVAAGPFVPGVAAKRLRLLQLMGRDRFGAVVAKVRAAHAALSAAHPRVTRVLGGADAEDDSALQEWWTRRDAMNSFSGKHARQQASLVANMQAAGLVPLGGARGGGRRKEQQGEEDQEGRGGGSGGGGGAGEEEEKGEARKRSRREEQEQEQEQQEQEQEQEEDQAVMVELGAGKGWLTAWLAAATGQRHLVLLDREASFQHKADKRLRHAALTRVACDLADLDAAALLRHHLDRHRHLMTMRGASCSGSAAAGAGGGAAAAGGRAAPAASAGPSGQRPAPAPPPLPSPAPWVAYGKHLCGAATDMALRACLKAQRAARAAAGADDDDGASDRAEFEFRGAAIATCCHHRCGWRSYLGRRQLAAFGIAASEFEAVVWCTGWALCGHGCAGEGGDSSGDGSGSGKDEDEDGGGSGGEQEDGNGVVGDAGDADSGAVSAAAAAPFHPSQFFPSRADRRAFGRACKELIDLGRAARLAAEEGGEEAAEAAGAAAAAAAAAAATGGRRRAAPPPSSSRRSRPSRSVAVVRYVDDPRVTGESTLLLWS